MRRRLAGVAATVWLLAVGRDVRRARRIARLDPPAPCIAVRVDPPPDGAEELERPAPVSSPQPIRMAALGDSSIAGVGATRLSACLAVQIAERVAASCGRPVEVRGHGVSGARTVDVADQAAALDLSDPPDVIVVVVGANDVAHLTPPWRYARAVATVHRDLRDRFGAPVVACSLPEFRAMTVVGVGLRLLAVGYGRLLGALQRCVLQNTPGVWWVDGRREAGPMFLRHPHAMAADGYHPSDLGYTLLAAALAPAIVAILRSEQPSAQAALP